MKILILFCILIALNNSNYSFSQQCNAFPCILFFDSEEIDSNFVVVAGLHEEKGLIFKVDEDGNKVWNLEFDYANVNSFLFVHKIRLFDIEGEFIYALVTSGGSATRSQVLKINKALGTIEYESPIFISDYESRFSSGIGLFDYNDSLLCFYHPLSDNNGNTFSGFELFTLNKSTNYLETIHVSNQALRGLVILSDHQENIIVLSHKYLFAGSTELPVIEKFNGLDFSRKVWKHTYSNPSSTSSLEIRDLMIDNSGNLYSFIFDAGVINLVILDKINGMIGEGEWQKYLSSKWMSDRKIFRNELYISLKDPNLFSTGHMLKINLETGGTVWQNTNYNFNTIGNLSSCSDMNSDIMSFDFGCDGAIYASGFDKSQYHANGGGTILFGTGSWGVMRISQDNGNVLSTNTISLDSLNIDFLSAGASCHVLDSSTLFFGNLQHSISEKSLSLVIGDSLLTNLDFPWVTEDIYVVCDSLTWIDGITYTSDNNSATFNLSSVDYCDSIVRLNLTVNQLDNSVTFQGDSLFSTENNASYQWLACDPTNMTYSVILNDTNQVFYPISNGSYAVAINSAGCSDTSTCIDVQDIGVPVIPFDLFRLYPNPVQSIFTIWKGLDQEYFVDLYSVNGKFMKRFDFHDEFLKIDFQDYQNGVYYLKLVSDNIIYNYKVIKI